MGLSVYYSATIKDYQLLDELIEECTDISQNINWKYTVFNNDKLKGICISPEGSEPLWLTFDPTGRICSVPSVMYNEPNDEFYYTSFTKTQFAGPDAHMALIKLFRYLSNKYFSQTQMSDEGQYWETNDEKILRSQFVKYNFILDKVAGALSNLKSVPGESAESLADRIEKLFNDMDKEGL